MNNKTNKPKSLKSNTKENFQARHWIATISKKVLIENKLENETDFLEFLKKICLEYICQLEKGEGGFEHYQCYLHTDKKYFKELSRELFNSHVEMCKSKHAVQYYCEKQESKIGTTHKWKRGKYDNIKTLKFEQMYDWELEIINIIEKEADDRKIYWYWDEMGGCGKTSFCKYLVIKHDAIYVKGKKGDMLYVAAQFPDSNIVLIDLSRTVEERVPYEAIEDLKNGLYMSGKYESSFIVRNPPHMFIFANFPPDEKALSKDRWQIREIERQATAHMKLT